MSRAGRFILGALALGVFGVVVVAIRQQAGIEESEIASRAETARPTWANYDEDIKAQIGAKPFAEWTGTPVEAYVEAYSEGALLFVRFAIEGPWAERPVALPVLARDSVGNVGERAGETRTGNAVLYEFRFSDGGDPFAAWIEVKYPHHERRIILDRTGRWRLSD